MHLEANIEVSGAQKLIATVGNVALQIETGSQLVRNWFATGSQLVRIRSILRTDLNRFELL